MDRLTFDQLRQYDLVDYFTSVGLNPTKIQNNNYWYLSPFRQERTASFKIDRQLNLWFDFGMGKGGNIIDFGMHYYNCTAIDFLRMMDGTDAKRLLPVPAKTYHIDSAKKSPIEITQVQPLQDRRLLSYLLSRKIELQFAQQYLTEVSFQLHDKSHRTIGFKNNSGGYELRSPYYKGSSTPKDITVIPGKEDHAIHVFEGFMDFLSYLSIKGKEAQQDAFLVLNSTIHTAKSISCLQHYNKVNLYLDHDDTGRKATEELLEALPQSTDVSMLYAHHKDLNEMLQNSKRILPKDTLYPKLNNSRRPKL